jgi:hypothetical protein
MIPHPAFNTIFKRTGPNVQVRHVAENIDNLTTYTFTGVNLGDLGSVPSVLTDSATTTPAVRSTGRKMVIVCVHGEDAATVFSVNGVTIGGVSGTELADRGGSGNASNTAIYVWSTDSLEGITSTDVEVTWSEAVTGCAIGVLVVDNLGAVDGLFAFSTTGIIAYGTGGESIYGAGAFYLACISATAASPNASVTDPFTVAGGNGSSVFAPTLLYELTNGEFSGAAWWAWSPQTVVDGQNGFTLNVASNASRSVSMIARC